MSTRTTRRNLMKGALAAGGAAVAATAARAEGDPAITELQDWNQYLGDGVDTRPYGMPSQYEKHVVRRNVEWLTADPVSSVNFTPLHELDGIITPNGLCFERHHAGIAVGAKNAVFPVKAEVDGSLAKSDIVQHSEGPQGVDFPVAFKKKPVVVDIAFPVMGF